LCTTLSKKRQIIGRFFLCFFVCLLFVVDVVDVVDVDDDDDDVVVT